MDTKCNFYMKQHGSLDNACGIIAALHAILNNPEHIMFEEGKTLNNFQMQTLGKSPADIATFLENYDDFKEQHRIFALKGDSKLANE